MAGGRGKHKSSQWLLSKDDFLELGNRLHIPDCVSEQAFELFCKEKRKDEEGKRRRVRRHNIYCWAALYLYKSGRNEGCPLTMKNVAGVCGILEKELWRLMRDREEYSLMRSYATASDLFPKFAAVFKLSIEERRKVLPLIHKLSQQFPSCSPDSVLSYAFYCVIGPTRKLPHGYDQSRKRQRKNVESLQGPISARTLTRYLGTSTTVLFRLKKLYEKSLFTPAVGEKKVFSEHL